MLKSWVNAESICPVINYVGVCSECSILPFYVWGLLIFVYFVTEVEAYMIKL